MKLASSAALILFGLGSIAHAQPGQPDGGPPVADPASPPPTPPMNPPMAATAPSVTPGIDQGVIDDAMSPGAFISPTALTEPAGTATVSVGGGADTGFKDTELSHVSASFSVTNQLTVGAAVLIPTVDLRIFGISGKFQILRSGRLRVALHGVLLFDTDSDKAGIVDGEATLCLDDACNSHVTGMFGVGIADTGSSAVPLAVSGSGVFQVAPNVKLVGELLTGFSSGDVGGTTGTFIGFAGLRVSNKNVGANVGAFKIFDNTFDSPTALFATVTARLL